MPYKYLLPGIALLVCFSCRPEENPYLIATGAKYSRHYRIGRHLADIINRESSYRLKPDTLGEGSIHNCNQILEGRTQFALAQNDVPLPQHQGKLRTVLPLYPQLLFIIYADSLQPQSLGDLIVGRKIAIGPRTGGTAPFTRNFLSLHGIDTTEYEFVYSHYDENTISDSIAVSISLTGYNNKRIEEMLLDKGGRIWSLDDPTKLGQGSSVEGFCLQYPYARPFVIPRNTYQNDPAEAVLTIALDNLLLAHESVDEQVIYDLVNTIFEKREVLANEDVLFRFIDDQFDTKSLQFSLHPGVKNYLNRNKPTFYERYAELLALLITLVTVSVGGMSTFWRWNKRRKKDRIDRYYMQVIQLENQAKQSPDPRRLHEILEELDQIRQKAFGQLVKDRLQADDSFRIFITLIQDVSLVIEKRIQELDSVDRKV